MEEKIRCQSCGMPISAAFENLGSESDGSPASEYCMFCYQNGGFTNPTQTLQEMLQSSIDFMTGSMEFTKERATELSNDIIPNLKRWN